jgi:DNA (cytosine-5)-methyltransferase 1
VKGLLSDNNGITFQNWCALLGRSMNTHINMFNNEDSLLYNLHFKVLNSKDFGVPQNRERVFLVGIRNDLPNTFRFPIGERLTKRLKDILEPEVDEKYYLSDKMIEGFLKHKERHEDRGNGFKFNPTNVNGVASTISTKAGSRQTDNYINESIIKIGQTSTTERSQGGAVYNTDGLSPTICAWPHGYASGYFQEPSVKIAHVSRSDEGKKIRSESMKKGKDFTPFQAKKIEFKESDIMNTITCATTKDNLILVKEATKQGYAIAKEGDSINLSNPNSETRRGRVGNQIGNTLDTACNQGVVVLEKVIQINPSKESGGQQPYQQNRVYADYGLMTTLDTDSGRKSVFNNHRIRRLTPLECMRLQGYPDSFVKLCSDSQTYKQAGNSITVNVMKAIIKNIVPIL